jgi:hypothetical protein
MSVVEIVRMHRLDDAASQGQASESQQDQTHGFVLGYSVVGGATVLTTTVGADAGVTTVTAGAGGVTGETDASVIALGRARSNAAVSVSWFFGSFRLVDRPTAFSASGNAATTCCMAVATTSFFTC